MLSEKIKSGFFQNMSLLFTLSQKASTCPQHRICNLGLGFLPRNHHPTTREGYSWINLEQTLGFAERAVGTRRRHRGAKGVGVGGVVEARTLGLGVVDEASDDLLRLLLRHLNLVQLPLAAIAIRSILGFFRHENRRRRRRRWSEEVWRRENGPSEWEGGSTYYGCDYDYCTGLGLWENINSFKASFFM